MSDVNKRSQPRSAVPYDILKLLIVHSSRVHNDWVFMVNSPHIHTLQRTTQAKEGTCEPFVKYAFVK